VARVPAPDKKEKTGWQLLLSVVVLALIVHIRPYIIVARSVQDIFLMRPQITEGVVLRIVQVPPLIVAAPCAMPVNSVPPVVPCTVSFTSSHPFSPPFLGLLKINSIRLY
jgi:hypothetical protein